MPRLHVPPPDPITEQQPAEDYLAWQRRDEAAKAARADWERGNQARANVAHPLEPEPDWRYYGFDGVDNDGYFRKDGRVVDLATEPPAVDAGAMDHYGWQQLQNLDRYGVLVTEPVSRPPDLLSQLEQQASIGPLPSDVRQVQVLTFKPHPGVATIIGRPGQGTHGSGANWQSDRAVDIALAKGTRVYAVAAGRISQQMGFGDTNQGGRLAGKRLHLEFGNDMAYYAHLDRIVVERGQAVREGQLIGYSGVANGVPHLHFAVKSSNPLAWVLRGKGK